MKLESKLRVVIVSISVPQVRVSDPRSLLRLISFHHFRRRLYCPIVIICTMCDVVVEIWFGSIFNRKSGSYIYRLVQMLEELCRLQIVLLILLSQMIVLRKLVLNH